MDLYLDANATTPVLPQAAAAALAAMADDFANPSSVHGAGLRARALVDSVRARARRVLGAPDGRVVFTSGATEGIQTAVLSALRALRGRTDVDCLLYGATEHKAVPEALTHWNEVLGLGLRLRAIPVDRHGRHDLAWLRRHAPRAGLVCTMAVNNETGVISDLDGIEAALAGSPALWLVDSVQALGKLGLALAARRIDYAPFSGHKLYAPKGIGMLYVRECAPFSPLIVGGGQEGAARSGTENMPGIAALGVVLQALEQGDVFRGGAALQRYRTRLVAALSWAFPGLVFNAPPEGSLPTTLNFSVPGLSAGQLLDAFDAAGVRVSGGSACSAARALPSHVLAAMDLPRWRAASAVRLSFGPAADDAFIDEACARIAACGRALRASCLVIDVDADLGRDPGDWPAGKAAVPLHGITRLASAGACCYVLADADSRRAVVIDPLEAFTVRIARLLACQGYMLAAVLDTHSHGDHASSAQALRAAMPPALLAGGPVDALGWPAGARVLHLGELSLSRLPLPGHTADSWAYLATAGLRDGANALPRAAFVGDTVMPGALGRGDLSCSAPLALAASLRTLRDAVGEHTLLLPAHDIDDRQATTLAIEQRLQPLLGQALAGQDDAAFAAAKALLDRGIAAPEEGRQLSCGMRVEGHADDDVALAPHRLQALLRTGDRRVRCIDVRESYEQQLFAALAPAGGTPMEAVPATGLLNRLPGWLAEREASILVFCCRSGNRSAVVARALRRLGHPRSFSLAGGLAAAAAMPKEKAANEPLQA